MKKRNIIAFIIFAIIGIVIEEASFFFYPHVIINDLEIVLQGLGDALIYTFAYNAFTKKESCKEFIVLAVIMCITMILNGTNAMTGTWIAIDYFFISIRVLYIGIVILTAYNVK